ncbi:MAG: hypothetical protein Q4F72_08200, partial [Desulfovibrionaceae bacterium]|nr:hypothetical protein [Desulfovibrionaceae bacterium]
TAAETPAEASSASSKASPETSEAASSVSGRAETGKPRVKRSARTARTGRTAVRRPRKVIRTARPGETASSAGDTGHTADSGREAMVRAAASMFGSPGTLAPDLNALLAALPGRQLPAGALEPREIPSGLALHCLGLHGTGDGILYALVNRGKVVRVGNEWLVWNGWYWERDQLPPDHMARQLCERVAKVWTNCARLWARQLAHDIARHGGVRTQELQKRIGLAQFHAEMVQTEEGQKRCLAAAAGNPLLSLIGPASGFDRQKWMLPCANGVVDLFSGELMAGDPRDALLHHTSAAFRGLDAPCPTWQAYVRDVVGGAEMADFLQRFLGGALAGLNDSKHLLLRGGENSGARLLVRMICQALGGSDTPLAAQIPGQMAGYEFGLPFVSPSGASGTSEISGPLGASGLRRALRLLFVEGGLWRTPSLQGTAQLAWTARVLTGSSDPNDAPAFCLLADAVPPAPLADKPFWDNLLVADLPLVFVDREPRAPHERRRDPGLEDELVRELPGILAWLVQGAILCRREGLCLPRRVQLASGDGLSEGAVVSQFLEDCCQLIPAENRFPFWQIYDAFVWWYQRVMAPGSRVPDRKWLAAQLNRRYDRCHSDGMLHYKGMGVRPDITERVEKA